MTIQETKLNPSFAAAVAAREGCASLARCYACGSCSGVCPVEKVVPEFDPRKIVHMVALGMEEELVASDVIWACSQCQSCIPVCPQEVRPADVIRGLREEALARGLVDVDRMAELGLLARVDGGKCVACLTCVRLCPFGAPRILPEGYAFIDPDRCRACGICVLECPATAIELAPSQEMRGMKGGAGHAG
ncbi:4Fe-4S dicluster domain-containing protein [Dissulfurirhabdus thermomarina]|uniref:4Fe-4S dicluster domain-containing protein n=1 Tax=Dissulfurirhabdus thermomarina TaxID=1765737 RepID=A0A6N9TSU9_DISTH|nr:4Fe-4S binding protein [Dissulfurirhabdus thermomarina]NDY42527.1 4Fe-4S dicluster domain-containing protein [Dissulfurirhabdus thermomarina]NMX23516.1 4Fe-4S binding protein [Dissulfurirhabdus thermomarina]